MQKTIILNLATKDDKDNINVKVQLIQNNIITNQWIGILPPCSDLANLYKEFQKKYIFFYKSQEELSLRTNIDDDFEIVENGITNVSKIDINEILEKKLKKLLNDWLSTKSFNCIDKQLRAILNQDDEILVVIETQDNQETLQRLPWGLWDFFETYQKANYALRRQEFKQNLLFKSKKIRILVIIGDRRGINVNQELDLIRKINGVECNFLIPQSPQEIFFELKDEKGWDILFFTGHSLTRNNSGFISFINQNGRATELEFERFSNAFNKAKKRLKLAIFNSCDGLGLAFALGRLEIPATVFMREPVPNKVAEEFFRHFLEAFIEKKLPLHLAVREAKDNLQSLENDFPSASHVPVLYQNSISSILWKDSSNSAKKNILVLTLLISLITIIPSIKWNNIVSLVFLEKKLTNELNNLEWQKANKTTDKILYKIMDIKNKEEVINGNLRVDKDKIMGIPCDTLKKIDNLWIQHSKKSFGFSQQAKVWEEIKDYDGNRWENFADRVGWRENGKWLDHSHFFSEPKPNKGYLPSFIYVTDANISWDTFFKKLEQCKLDRN